jgi:DnaK suppressor protein
VRDDIDLAEYKQLLEQRLAIFMQWHETQQNEGAPVAIDQTCVGRLSRMDAMQQQSMALATSRRNEIEKQRINTALNRVASGEYGYCVKCDEKIALGRLRVDPATLICIDCARDAEKK